MTAVKLIQTGVKCAKCGSRFDVDTTPSLEPLPLTWSCFACGGERDLERQTRSKVSSGPVSSAALGRFAMSLERADVSPPQAVKATKYHNIPTEVDGHRFRSTKEAHRYGELKLQERAGEIINGSLVLQQRFSLDVNGEHICFYDADFVYELAGGVQIVEDVKGRRSTKDVAYRLFTAKKRLMKACLGIDVVEV